MDRSHYKLSRLERLPTELIAMILCELDCVGTLMNAIRASPRLWYVYLEFMSLKKYSRIATRVLYNQLDTYDVRHAAISALRYNAIFAGMTDINEVKYFFTNYYNHPSVVKLDCPWMYYNDMASVNKLHGTVSRLADTYLKGIPGIWGGRPGIWTNPTVSEKGRVMRALYYLEMYFNLVREHWILPEMDEGDEIALAHGDQHRFADMDCLLQQFAPWENEQMTSVWEFLVALVVEGEKSNIIESWRCTSIELILASSLQRSRRASRGQVVHWSRKVSG
ncbi:uncharacterized protein F4807DRAFT_404020 [Annulohypoxylon truncatum]|uniref:uncharacterized protein n=1 Tax=Annulohypoxylon truncatum TaxID=327061 RepID=UPI002007E9CE|nr:uncharacterized protein F4807DRAFT_404020 [Annulohypoxylon truncatum]KAI1214630.1 hypothetical protein F4807DRAFT_404020 [Annulohypoxylon truncatum]